LTYILFNVDDRVTLHVHLFTYAIACFCFFAQVFWGRDSVLFQKMCHSSPHNSENIDTFQSIAGKHCLIEDGNFRQIWLISISRVLVTVKQHWVSFCSLHCYSNRWPSDCI